MLASRRREYSSKVEQVTVNHSVKVRFLLFPQIQIIMKLSAIDVLTQIENLLFTNYVRFTSIIDYDDDMCSICYRLGKSSIAPLNKSTCIGDLVQKKLETLIQEMIEPSIETCTICYHPQTGVISVRTKFDQDIIDLFFTDSERKTIINFDDYDRVNIS